MGGGVIKDVWASWEKVDGSSDVTEILLGTWLTIAKEVFFPLKDATL